MDSELHTWMSVFRSMQAVAQLLSKSSGELVWLMYAAGQKKPYTNFPLCANICTLAGEPHIMQAASRSIEDRAHATSDCLDLSSCIVMHTAGPEP